MPGDAKYFQHVEVQTGCKTMAKKIDFKRKYFGYTRRSNGKTKNSSYTSMCYEGFSDTTTSLPLPTYLNATDMGTLFTSPVVTGGPHKQMQFFAIAYKLMFLT
jgi:hypothetical protein